MKRVISLSVALLICIVFVCGCDFSLKKMEYDEFDKYTRASSTVKQQGNVNKIFVDWLCGKVIVNVGAVDEITFFETKDGEIEEKAQMYYCYDANELKIEFCKTGILGKIANFEKTLNITIPEKLNLNELEIETTSADVSVDGIKTSKLSIETVSGTVDAFVNGDLDKLEIESVSGEINAVSGIVSNVDAKTDSASVTLCLPPNQEFTAEFETQSGEFLCDFNTEKSGNKYICKKGLEKFEFETVSGNVFIKEQ